MKVAVYPGSFNPWTKGHQNILDRALKIFDKVIVAIAINPDKFVNTQLIADTLQPVVEQSTRLKDGKCIQRVEVIQHKGLIADLGLPIVRGVRSGDWEYEQNLARWNKELGVETIFLCPEPRYSHINSTALRQLFAAGESMERYAGNPDSIQIWMRGQKDDDI